MYGVLNRVRMQSEEAISHITERELLQAVMEMAQAYGYIVYHALEQAHYSRRTCKGFPDIVMYRKEDIDRGWGNRLLAMELKSQKGRLTQEQELWLGMFRALGVEAYVIRPSDLEGLPKLLD
jgi:hypothetical protein